MAKNQPGSPSPLTSALLLRCPVCARGKLYDGLLKTKKRCDVCGFDISAHDAADGPAFFGITIIGILAGFLASIVEIKYSPPTYIHFLIWPPFVLVGTVMCLIWFKSLFIAAQYMFRVGAYEKEKVYAKKERHTPRKKTGPQKNRSKKAARTKKRRTKK